MVAAHGRLAQNSFTSFCIFGDLTIAPPGSLSLCKIAHRVYFKFTHPNMFLRRAGSGGRDRLLLQLISAQPADRSRAVTHIPEYSTWPSERHVLLTVHHASTATRASREEGAHALQYRSAAHRACRDFVWGRTGCHCRFTGVPCIGEQLKKGFNYQV